MMKKQEPSKDKNHEGRTMKYQQGKKKKTKKNKEKDSATLPTHMDTDHVKTHQKKRNETET
jgi:hypothetical protein